MAKPKPKLPKKVLKKAKRNFKRSGLGAKAQLKGKQKAY
jgi:hypothetical protein